MIDTTSNTRIMWKERRGRAPRQGNQGVRPSWDGFFGRGCPEPPPRNRADFLASSPNPPRPTCRVLDLGFEEGEGEVMKRHCHSPFCWRSRAISAPRTARCGPKRQRQQISDDQRASGKKRGRDKPRRGREESSRPPGRVPEGDTDVGLAGNFISAVPCVRLTGTGGLGCARFGPGPCHLRTPSRGWRDGAAAGTAQRTSL